MPKSSSSNPESLPLRWAVILMSGLLIAVLVGALTLAEARSWPAALLAALAAAGMTATALSKVVGR